MLRLESLTRDCFEIAREYWLNPKKDADSYRNMEEQINVKIAERLSSVLNETYPDNPDYLDSVFVAPRYRGVGLLKPTPGAQIDDKKDPDFWYFAERFGKMANGGKHDKSRYFMPVAFWNYYIYEKPITFLDRMGIEKEVTLSGFSGWTAEHGFLVHKSKDVPKPIHGFHFTFDPDPNPEIPPADFVHGILNIRFPARTNCFDVTAEFMKALDTGENFFSRGGVASQQPFPVIKPQVTVEERTILQAIFSTFFFSNFRALPVRNDPEWKRILDLKKIPGESPAKTIRSLTDFAADRFCRYRTYAQYLRDEKILTFDHYYAFLLNPSLEFRNKGGKDMHDAAIGTVNLYSKFPIDPILLGLVRKHLESIYHFLRELEDWEDAEKEGADTAFSQMSEAMGHEVSKVYATTYGIIIARRKPPEKSTAAFVRRLTEMTLQYGMLWGSSSASVIPADGYLWDKRGKLIACDSLVKCLLRESWRLCLVTDIVRGLGDSQISNEDWRTFDALWNAAESLYTADSNCSSTGLANLPIRNFLETQKDNLSRAIYRWMLAVLGNAWKHIIGNTYSVPSEFLKLEPRKKLGFASDAFALLKGPNPSLQLSVAFESEDHAVVASVSNTCNILPEARQTELKGTLLVMMIAGQEIWKCLNKGGSINEVAKHSQFGYNTSKGLWISSLRIPT